LLWLSLAASAATISLTTVAWLLTGSVGLLSDAAESVVNLVAVVVAIAALRWATKPADEECAYEHAKAEYFSAGVEGSLIFIAAISIATTAIGRLLHPQGIHDVGSASRSPSLPRSSTLQSASSSCAPGAGSA
jgi:cation diffusion facilitator family transporter